MNKIMLLAALAALGACSKETPAPAPEATATAAATPAEVMAADGKSPVGKFQITRTDGTVINEELTADGKYADRVDGKIVETGTWTQKAPETFCYTNDKAGSQEVCNTEGVDAKGVWTTTTPDGRTATVVRVEG